MARTWTGIAALMLLLWPAGARAEWLFTPSIGTTFGGDAFGSHRVFGIALGAVDEDAFGWEADVSFAPDFFDGTAEHFNFDGGGSVFAAMANAIVGIPVAGQGTRFRPYVTGGLGLMQMHVLSDGGLFETTTRETGWNLGLGAIAFVGGRVGLRGDFRYVRSFQNQTPSWTRNINVDVAPGNFDFWRATVGLTFRMGG